MTTMARIAIHRSTDSIGKNTKREMTRHDVSSSMAIAGTLLLRDGNSKLHYYSREDSSHRELQ